MGKKVKILFLIVCLLVPMVFNVGLAVEKENEDGTFINLGQAIGKGKNVPVLTADTIKMDGQLDEWSGYSSFALPSDPDKQVKIDGWGGLDDLSGKAYVAHDEEAFYIAVQVLDNAHYAVPGSGMYGGDSIQFAFGSDSSDYGPEYGFSHVNGESEVWRWSKGDAVLDSNSVQLTTAQNGKETFYEAKIPWGAIFADKPTGKIKFSILMNDNDGNGRRGWLEWTGGIGTSKDPAKLGFLDLIPKSDSWSVWIEGDEEITTSEAGKYSLFVPNYGDRSVDVQLSVPEAELEKEVTIPPQKVFTQSIDIGFSKPGTHSVKISVKEPSTGKVKEDTVTVNVHSSREELESRLDEIESKLPELKKLLSTVEERGIPTDYERVDVMVISDFIKYGRDDLDREKFGRALYVIEELEKLYDKTKSWLEAYLEGKEEAKSVPRYVTGRPEIKDYSFIGDTYDSETGKTKKRPIFFTGYGHFDQVRKDIPKFTDYGTNIIQVETGPNRVIMPPDSLVNWNIQRSGGVKADAKLDRTAAHNGKASMHITNTTAKRPNVYLSISQRVSVKPNTTYQFRAWVKGKNVKDVWFPGGPDWKLRHFFPKGTYDWTEVTYEYTTGDNETDFDLRILSENVIDGLWIDDIIMTEAGRDKNLLKNPGFEQGVPPEGKEWLISKQSIESDIQQVLENASKNNVAVNLLLSPHYFPSWALEKWPELKSDNPEFFLRYNFDDPKAKEIIEDYLRTLIPMIKEYPSLHSLTLTNEPTYKSSVDEQHIPKWHAYLSEVYKGNIDELNRIYGTDYSSFEEVAMPKQPEKTPLFYDWYEFNNTLVSGWHEWMADIIHEIAPELPVKTKIMGHTLSSLKLLTHGVELEQFSKFNQINGNDVSSYLDEGEQGFFKAMRFYDLQTSLRKAPIFNSEHHVIRDGDENYVPEQAEFVRANLWQSAIHGLSASTVWAWERTNDPGSVFHGSLLHRPDVVSKVGKTGLDLNRLAHEVTAFQEDKAEIAILYSTTSTVYGSNYYEAVASAYEAASYSGQKVGFISEKQIQEGKLKGKKLLIIPQATHVKGETLKKIEKFSKQRKGNLLIIGEDSLKFDEHNQPLSVDVRNKVFEKSQTVEGMPSAIELRDLLLPLFSKQKLNKVMLMDTETNQPVYGVEWRSVKYKGKTLINITNYTDKEKQVYITVNGKRIRDWTDRLNDSQSDGETLELQPLTPSLLSIDK
ncbi:beta-galactosidase [Metabacillus arenae]|uniref:Beta-galactosidase n=1 Tax=Metabacillus arenae TaxID=2771434 RepID=A0A926NF07_9BACI|nr:beta-galactosidase [Metabacillus arenae]MBD1382274.1 beta-galactosidase [Metabacillus arenae]